MLFRSADVPADAADDAATLVSEGMQAAAAEILGDIPAAIDVAVQPRWGASG